MEQMLNLLNSMNPQMGNTNKTSHNDRSQYANNFSRHNRLQNFPYNIQWKDGKSVNDSAKSTIEKGTPNPLQRNTVNVAEEVLWCMACQSPHSLNYYDVAQSVVAFQEVEEEDPEEKNLDSIA